jgi:8-oxo-dGTP pyrophosphatase MutT (NUDIX family)
MDNFIKKIGIELHKPLPGKNAQIKMAPVVHLNRFSMDASNARKGGVLLLLSYQNDELHVTLIKRVEDGGAHSGQISFPGGKSEDFDTDIVGTAMRETFEEVGIEPEKVDILGSLSSLYIPVSNYLVFPAVGFIADKPRFVADPNEVDKILNIPLEYFLSERYIKTQKINARNYIIDAPCYQINGYTIWGATAMIMSEFVDIVRRLDSINLLN